MVMMSSFKRMSQRDNHNLVLRDGNHKNKQVYKTVPLLSIIFCIILQKRWNLQRKHFTFNEL